MDFQPRTRYKLTPLNLIPLNVRGFFVVIASIRVLINTAELQSFTDY